jgi:hypothetical protein
MPTRFSAGSEAQEVAEAAVPPEAADRAGDVERCPEEAIE